MSIKLRLAKLEPTERTTDMIHVLKFEDIENFKIDYSKIVEKPTIGFKQNTSKENS